MDCWRSRHIPLLLLLALCLTVACHRDALAQPSDPGAIEADFQDGLEALEAGDAPQAIKLLLAILAADPTLDRVRLELARAYFLNEDWSDARREFFVVLSADVPDAVRDNVIRFLRAIDARRGWTWKLDAGLRNAPGAGRRYRSDTVTVNVAGEPVAFEIDQPDDHEIGAFVDAGLEFRRPLIVRHRGGTLSGVAAVEVAGSRFKDDDFNEEAIGGDFRLQWAFPQTTYSIGPTARRFWEAGARTADSLGLAITAEHRTRDGIQLFGRLAQIEIDDAQFDGRDGWRSSAQLEVGRSLDGRSFVSAAMTMGSFDADVDWESYHFVRLGFTALTELRGGWAPRIDIAGGITRFKERSPLFFDRRKDEELSSSLTLEKRNLFFGPFTPFVTVGLARQFSNIEVYDYWETIWRVGLRRAF